MIIDIVPINKSPDFNQIELSKSKGSAIKLTEELEN